MTDPPHVRIHKWYSALEREKRNEDLAPTICERFSRAVSEEERRTYTSVLVSEYERQGRYDEASEVLLKEAIDRPDDPFPLLRLAELRLYYENDPERALEIVDQAIVRAVKSGDFRRYSLGVKARVTLSLEDYETLEQCLREIIGLEVTSEAVDIGKERDFFDRTPDGAISEDVRKAYEDFLSGK